MNFLVTGGAGYLGTMFTLMALNKGHRVVIYDNFRYDQAASLFFLSGYHPGQYTVINADVRDYRELGKALRTTDCVIHLAAIVGAPACDKHPEDTISINQTATENLVKLLSANQRIIYPNTNSGYGTVPNAVCDENTPLNPISSYGQTKLAGERAVLDHNDSFVFRLATVFGISPRMRFDLLVNQLTLAGHFNKKIVVFDGHLRRNFVYVRDVAECFLWASEVSDIFPRWRVYNLGNDGSNMTKMELASLIGSYTGAEITDGVGSDPDQRDYMVSSDKLARDGFSPSTHVSVGIRELIHMFGSMPDDRISRARFIDRMNTTCV